MAKMSPGEKRLAKQINDASRRAGGKRLMEKAKRMRRGSMARARALTKGINASSG